MTPEEYNIASTNEKYDFTEKESDTETGLNYFGARYYDSDLGRWTSVDPLAHLRPGLSPYQYVQNNPLIRFDPNGMIDWWKVAGGALTTIGGFVETVAGGTIATTTGVTGIGAAGGAALMVHGLATTSFGFAQLVDGFAETGKNIPSGPLEATGKGLGGETGETIGRTLDAGIGLISSSPIKNVKTIDKLLPTCAKETKNFGLKQKAKVVKETFDLGSAAKSTNDVIENSIKLLPNPNDVEKQKDDELNKQ